MKKRQCTALVAIAIAISCSGCIDNLTGEMQKQETIVNQVKPFAEDVAHKGDPGDIILRGNALIWNLTSNTRSPSYDLLPDSLKARSSDGLITVFLIKGTHNVKVGTYSISGEPAYEQYIDISAIYWPEKLSAGFHSVMSEEPRSSREVQQNPEYGDPNKPIADWIEKLTLKSAIK